VRYVTSYPPETGHAPDVHRPEHRLSQLTTYELRDYHRELEQAITYFDRQSPVPPARRQLKADLDAVVAEQDARSAASGCGGAL
jgi:hypothetical protein